MSSKADSSTINGPVRVGLKELYKSKEGADLKIKCGEKEILAHSNVMWYKSGVLEKMIDEEESKQRDAVMNEITLPDDPVIVQKMLQFLYTSDYDDELQMESDYVSVPMTASIGSDSISTNSEISLDVLTPDHSTCNTPTLISPPIESSPESMITHVKVYNLADTYAISELKDLAKEKYKAAISRDWKDKSFVKSLEELYLDTPNDKSCTAGIKEVALNTIQTHTQDLLDCSDFSNLLKKNGELAFDVLHHSVVEKKSFSVEFSGRLMLQPLMKEFVANFAKCLFMAFIFVFLAWLKAKAGVKMPNAGGSSPIQYKPCIKLDSPGVEGMYFCGCMNS